MCSWGIGNLKLMGGGYTKSASEPSIHLIIEYWWPLLCINRRPDNGIIFLEMDNVTAHVSSRKHCLVLVYRAKI